MSDSLRPHGLHSPWNSPGHNTGVRSLFLLQGNLPNPGMEPRSPVLQVDSLPAESPGKPFTYKRSLTSNSGKRVFGDTNPPSSHLLAFAVESLFLPQQLISKFTGRSCGEQNEFGLGNSTTLEKPSPEHGSPALGPLPR